VKEWVWGCKIEGKEEKTKKQKNKEHQRTNMHFVSAMLSKIVCLGGGGQGGQ